MKSPNRVCRGAWAGTALATVVLTAAMAATAWAQAEVTALQTAPLYAEGGTLTVSCSLAYPAGRSLDALMWTPQLPAGWDLLAASGGGAQVDPYGESVVFFGALTGNPFAFTYTVSVPDGMVGVVELGGLVEYQLDGTTDLVLLTLAPTVLADVTASHTAVGYLAGTLMTVSCSVAYPAGVPLDSLLWTPELPAGWSLVSATGGGAQVDPYGESIVFFGSLTSNPFTFTYRVSVPSDATGTKFLGGSVEYQLAGMATPAIARGEPAPLQVRAMHTLRVVSAHGAASPSVGTYTNFHGTVLALTNSASEVSGTRVFACTGWAMSGNEPASGVDTAFAMTVTGNAVLTWNWSAPLISPAGSVTVTMDEDGAPMPWQQPAITAMEDGLPAGSLVWSLAAPPAHGVSEVSGTGTSPTLAYTPGEHWFGADRFSVVVEDGLGGSDTLVVDVTVGAVNDVPRVVAPLPGQEAWEDTAFAFAVDAAVFHDDDVVDTLTWSATGLPAWLAFDATSRTFSGTPLEGQDGVSSITVQVQDPQGAIASQTFELVAHAVNDGPQAGVGIPGQTATEDVGFNLALDDAVFTDSDAGDVLAWSATGLPAWLAFDALTHTFGGTPREGQDGVSTITVAVRDLAGEVAQQSFQLVVAAVDDSPEAADLTLTTAEDTPVVGQIAASDAEGVPLAFAVVQHPAHGAFALAQDGTVAFTPALDWSGTDIARVSVCDGTTGPVTVTITLSVLPVVDPLRLLVVLDRSTLETWGAELAPHVYAPDGRPVTFALAGQPLRGSVTLGPDGRVDYTRSVGFLAGVDYIPVVASDGQSTVALMLKVVVTDEDGEDVPPVAAYISRIAVAADAAGGRTAVLDIDCPAWPILQTCTDLMVADWQDVPELGDAEPRVTVAAGGDGSYAFTLQLDAGRVRFFRVRLP